MPNLRPPRTKLLSTLAATLICSVAVPAFAQAADLTVGSAPEPLRLHRLPEGKVKSIAGLELPPRFEPLCSTPCRLSLPPGEYQLGFARDSGTPIRIPRLTLLPGSVSHLAVEYRDRSTQRAVGFGAMAAGALAGSLLILMSRNSGETDSAVLGLGIGTAVVGIVSGLTVVALNPNEVKVVGWRSRR